MIKDRAYKLIVVIMLLVFATGLFFAVRFLRAEITNATSSLSELSENSGGSLNLDAWNKIKHRFIQ